IGCSHYQRSAKLQAHCCGKWFTCRFCHDEISDHNIIRNLTTTMMCMYCSTVQPAGQQCINTACGRKVSKYYCHECKLWDDDPKKNIYHCYDCGICRIGKGLGIDYFHCKKCNVCMAISLKNRHKCIERNLESDCPICGEYMFTSTTTVIFMPCGHCIHYKCHQEYIHTSYQCPTCFKSLANMTEYFRRIDAMLEQHQMPPEYAKTVSHIYCNDCEKRSDVKFHFLYHKCGFCSGYNTKVLRTSEKKSIEPEPTTDTDGTKPLSDQSAALDDAAKAPNAAVSSEATSLASSSTPSSSSSQADLNEGLNDVTTTFTYQTRSAASRGSVSRTLTRLFSDQN
ncbi:zinc-ribbon-domain-containing protein, partial [Polychytrium aggregatum]|uniref:zinc-ribbon-domain-containing protein n=1 Tax=Polychytrium aggregatum TaxID=110093 RepID=UPI0022FE026C